MKMTKEHFDRLSKAVKEAASGDTAGMAQRIGWTHAGYRWWAFHRARASWPEMYRELYDYLNDDHIDTALRKILGDAFAS